MAYIEKVIKEIEELRQELDYVAGNLGLRDPRVLQVSQRLDQVLNDYYRFKLSSEGEPNPGKSLEQR